MRHADTRRLPTPHALRLHALAAALLLAGAALWTTGARAADAHAEPAKPAAKAKAADHAEPAKPAAKPAAKAEAHAAGAHEAPAPAAKGAAPQDPMDALRERLAAKLGATKAPEAKTPYVVRVVAKADAQHGQAPAARSREHTAKVVAALRAEKAAQAHGADGAAPAGEGHAAHWSYDGDGGPETWGRLKPEFAKCANGTRQSPIDIRGGITVELDPVKFEYQPIGFNVLDNGHTVQVNVGSGNAIEVMGRRYDLVQFHFHRPAEERINGRRFDMVAHLVHKDPEGRLAVVAVLLDRGTAHPLIQSVWNNLPLEKGDELPARISLDLNELLPKDRRYYTYMGSLTTPPCSEGVLWMVMQQPVTVSPEQIAVFARLYPMNARPIQSAAGRLIKQSN
ncbi:carbonic anhydrase [Ideonella sp. A 288]|uniref:carbonic anhydrase n=1 Tax=Ideonella sp. A 288 TaxID=1962181 RepID=UPI000B4B6AC1|nr:carbonic anhydrase family protein [Ideonella sp. A 288]